MSNILGTSQHRQIIGKQSKGTQPEEFVQDPIAH